jgi:ABC-type antimicrobial peptide transport system permease subunit
MVDRQLAPLRANFFVLGIFAILALMIAIVGIYGIVAYLVDQRTGEIAIRIALGAKTPRVLGLVLGMVLRMTLTGIAAGLVGAYLLTGVLRSQIYDTSPTDPLVLAGSAALMVLTGLAAAYAPARRATRVDPSRAMRGAL